MAVKKKIVYVIGAGFSVSLGFPTINNLLVRIWDRLISDGSADLLADLIRFHHPAFNPTLQDTFVNVERLLSEMKANEELFDSSRPATGSFTSLELNRRRRTLLLAISTWFHELQKRSLKSPPLWLSTLVQKMIDEDAQIISFNWDLILDQLLFGNKLSPQNYALTDDPSGPRLIKPHGSLNWYEQAAGRHLKKEKSFLLFGSDANAVYAFKPYRAPKSSARTYMPLIVPPVFNKDFTDPLFRPLWREAVAVLSTASEVYFLGYSLADADFHARFILRCGFYNQENGMVLASGGRSKPTGRASVTVVDPARLVKKRISDVVGWPITFANKTVEDWITL
jgi:hypothetical protein